jgi:hypothetical protein
MRAVFVSPVAKRSLMMSKQPDTPPPNCPHERAGVTPTTVARYRPRGAFYCGHTDEFWLTCWMRTHGWTRDQAEGCLRDVLVSGRMEAVP